MKKSISLFISSFIVGVSVLAAVVQKPNVLIIYGDDVGYADVGIYGSGLIPTPHIDKLAKGGLLFTDGHCAAATCTPSRFSLLTGMHGFRKNARVLAPNAPLIVPTDTLTLPKMFKRAGYHTAVIGKWHLGIGDGVNPVDWNGDVKPGPLEVGFDYSFLLPSTNDRVPCVYVEDHKVVGLDAKDPLYVGNKADEVSGRANTQYADAQKNPEAMTYYRSSHGHDNSVINGIGRIGFMSGGESALWDDEMIADVFVDKAKAYIKKHKAEPFFLYFASQDIHVPRAPHKRFRGKSDLGYRGDAMVQLDWTVGALVKALKQNGVLDNTIIIFSSDNGPVYDDGYADGSEVHCSTEEVDRGHDGSGIYRGGKYQIYEGGTRVPFIITWPGRIQAGKSDALVSQIDFLASFADLLKVPLADGEAVDSRNCMNAFLGNDALGHTFIIEESFGLALREGKWKYVDAAKPGWPAGREPIAQSLYDLEADPGEQYNLIETHGERANRMAEKLKQLAASEGIR